MPVIACTHGVCFGGGLQIALGCDFRFSTADCQFSVMESKWGLIPDMSGSVLLRELTSISTAKEVRALPFIALPEIPQLLLVMVTLTQALCTV